MTIAPEHSITYDPSGTLLLLGKTSDFSRLIVSLSRNSAQWLTPLGWSFETKSIALRAENTPDGLQLTLPASHFEGLSPGDTLELVCTEIDYQSVVTIADMAVGPAGRPPHPTLSEVVTADIQKTSTSSGKKMALTAAILAVPIIGIAAGASLWISESGEFVGSTSSPSLPTATQTVSEMAVEPQMGTLPEHAEEKGEPQVMEASSITAIPMPEQNSAFEPLGDTDEIGIKTRIEKTEPQTRLKAVETQTEVKVEKSPQDSSDIARTSPAPETLQAALPTLPEQNERPINRAKNELASQTFEISSAQIERLQEDLQLMKYYRGPITGELDETTLSALSNFKLIFEIDATAPLDRTLLARANKERLAFVATLPATQTMVDTSIVEPTQRPVILTESDPVLATESVEDVVEPSLAPSKIAEAIAASSPTEGGAMDELSRPDLVIIKRDAPIYPDRALSKRSIPDDITVTVGYGVEADGRVVNAQVKDISYKGSLYAAQFKAEATRVVQSQEFEPLDGPYEGLELQITFRK